MEIRLLLWVFALLWGAVIGCFYFGGLWFTLKIRVKIKKPTLWLIASYAVRVLVALIGFWTILREDLMAFFITFIAFFITRSLIIRVIDKYNPERIHAH
jgi:F1F0 ATPase subunit 2